jgi:hypothetical protein
MARAGNGYTVDPATREPLVYGILHHILIRAA